MTYDFVLAYNINLNKIKIKIYHLDSSNQYVSEETVNSLIPYLNDLENLGDVMDTVASLDGIVKTEIYNLSDELILISSLV